MLPPRTRLALTAGLILAAAGAFLLGPSLKVFAESDDSASFWRAEYARKAAQRAQPAPAPGARRDELQRQVTAYAPTAQPGAFGSFSQPGGSAANLSLLPLMDAEAARRAPRRHANGERPRAAASNLVCVRLCDGYFFPAPTGLSATDAGCAAVCPNAPTRLYSMRSDRIADAVSIRDGAPYSRLPVALHYTRVREQTCSCGAPDPRSAIMTDASLRRGDRFMADAGFLIYQGGDRKQISRRDFKNLAEARGVPRQERALLVAMERVSVPRAQQLASGVAAGTHVALGAPMKPVSVAVR